MKKIGSRIEINQDKEITELFIYPFIEKQKLQLLTLWILAFTACGAFIFGSLFFYDFKNDKEIIMIVIFLIFWGYFEYKVVYALQWNKKGKEVLTFKEGVFSYMKQISKRGLPAQVSIDSIEGFKYAEDSEGGIWNDINNSSFMVGGEVVEYKAGESIKRLGMKLTKKDADKLSDFLNKQLKK